MPTDWNQRYREGDTPWDSGIPSRELRRVLDEEAVTPCRALELGSGTGTNAVYLAARGFDVTAIDVAAPANELARRRAADANMEVSLVCGDVCAYRPAEPFDFIFDRGCYHAVRRERAAEFLEMLTRVTRPGSRFLVLTGNANEQTETGPPRLSEEEIRAELGPLFDIDWIREFRFEDPGGIDGPLGWSAWMRRSTT